MLHPTGVVLVQHLHGGAGPAATAAPRLLSVALYVAVGTAGLLLAPALTRVDTRRRLWLLAPLSGSYAALLTALALRDEVSTLAVLMGVWFTTTGVSAAVRGARLEEVVSGAAIIGVQMFAAGGHEGIGHAAIAGAHLAAAAVWLGGVLHLAVYAGDPSGRWLVLAAARRFTPWAAGSAGLLAGSGVLLWLSERLTTADLTGSVFGRIVLAKVLLLLCATALGLTHRHVLGGAVRRVRTAGIRVEAAALASAALLAAVLVGVQLPTQAVRNPAPGLAIIDFNDGWTASVFAVRRDARNAVVQVVSDESVLVADRGSGRTRQLGAGGSTTLPLQDGRIHVDLISGQQDVRLDVAPVVPAALPAQLTGASTREWLDYQLGAALGESARRTTFDTVAARTPTMTPTRSLVGVLRTIGVDRLRLVSDSSGRATSFVRQLRAGGLDISDEPTAGKRVLLALDGSRAVRALERIARHPGRAVGGIYLAPWLLDGTVLANLARLRLPPVIVSTFVDPMSPSADRFRARLGAVADGVPPSVAGLLGYLDASGDTPAVGPTEPGLFAATPVGFLPGVLETGHDHDSAGWVSGGALVPITDRYSSGAS